MKLQTTATKNEQGEYAFQGQPIHVGDELAPRTLRSINGNVYVNRIDAIQQDSNGIVWVELTPRKLTTEEVIDLIKRMKKA